MTAKLQRTPFEVAQNLQSRVPVFSETGVSQTDLEDLSWLLTRVMEMEQNRDQYLLYQRAYHTKKYHSNPEFAADLSKRNIARAKQRYHTDDNFREKELQRKKEAYARKKVQNTETRAM